ncbi:MarR family winged helix-turn-helix transcriptional regulator [Desertivirga brevis]|uniref:MarR family winged helix-turn-helix transcriptional regulator n=1 Tax=Desertivirga brevis TaxID=2810310 RepID=UPI001A95A498|nr:MarR family winged helix-turn-helix transcriptional regulator [Pedobacter sp. SYSU D00873]
MSYLLLKDILNYVEIFDADFEGEKNLPNFSNWLHKQFPLNAKDTGEAVNWEGKAEGRSAESAINTSLVHLFRYAKIYSKLAVADSPFASIDEVVFLLNLLHKGSMSKQQLIDLNIHEKSTGIQIINRLISRGFVKEDVSESDKRSRSLTITGIGKDALDANMEKVRKASRIVTGNLDNNEKLQLVHLLQKLENFHEKKLRAGRPENFEL